MADIQEQAKLLIKEAKSERLDALRHAFMTDPLGAYHLGIRLQLDSSDARDILASTIMYSDASTVQWWLEFYVTIAGCRRFTQLLEELENTESDLFEKSMYWTANLSSVQAQKDVHVLEDWLRKR